MRTAFLQKLTSLMNEDEKLIVITADMGFSVFEEMQVKFPKRFINTGVTEQASISIATGIALSGYKVFFYAQAPFATMRCFEQVRLDVAYNHIDLKIVGVASGFASNQLGVSHFALEDVALMRVLPGMTIFTPGDPIEADWATSKAYELLTPCYIRLTKAGSRVIHEKPLTTKVGEMISLDRGDAGSLFVSGNLLPLAYDIKEELKKKNIHLSLISVPTVKPLDTKYIKSEARNTKHIFTLEEHSIIGGLGSAVAEVIAEEHLDVTFKRFGAPDRFTSVTGSPAFLLEYNGISVDKISAEIEKLL